MCLCILFSCSSIPEPSCGVDVGGDRWPMRWKEVFIMQGCFARFLAIFISLIVSNDVCVGFDFADGDVVVGHIYYSGYEGLIASRWL